jgi:ubiquinone/menaquinone biosynthesis C-methylase UbiE
VELLDVGAGPFTTLGKELDGRRLRITAVDPLADYYDRVLERCGIRPSVRTERCAAEELSDRFDPESFDLVYARNAMDHAHDPELALREMVAVAKRGCYVLLEHRQNEAVFERYSGLHQWNLCASATGDFLVWSPTRSVNLTEKLRPLCEVSCELLQGGDWLVTRIRRV